MAKNNKEVSVEEQRKEALKLTLAKLDKAYGKGAVRALGDTPVEDVEVYSTGSRGIDAILGVLLKYMVLNHQGKRPSLYTLSPKYKKQKEQLPL